MTRTRGVAAVPADARTPAGAGPVGSTWVDGVALDGAQYVPAQSGATPSWQPWQALALDTASGTNADAVVTYPGVPGVWHAITDGIAYSYSGTGTLSGGELIIQDGTTTVFDLDIASKAAGFVPYRRHASAGNALVVTLKAGGASVVGKVTVLGYNRLVQAPADVAASLTLGDYLQSWMLGVA